LLVQEPILPVPDHKQYAAMFGAPDFQTIAQANAASQPKSSQAASTCCVHAGPRRRSVAAFGCAAALPIQRSCRGETVVGVDTSTGRIFVDRTRSGQNGLVPDFPARMSAPLKHSGEASIQIQIVVDNNSIEVFAERRETVLTNLIYPSPASQAWLFYATATPPDPRRGIRDVELIPLQPSQLP